MDTYSTTIAVASIATSGITIALELSRPQLVKGVRLQQH